MVLPSLSQAHGLGGNVPNHHRWINMAEQCETHGIADRWTLGAKHPRFNGHYGALQFNPGTWTSTVTGYPMLSRYRTADKAPPWAQMAAGELLRRKHGMGQWSCSRYWVE